MLRQLVSGPTLWCYLSQFCQKIWAQLRIWPPCLGQFRALVSPMGRARQNSKCATWRIELTCKFDFISNATKGIYVNIIWLRFHMQSNFEKKTLPICVINCSEQNVFIITRRLFVLSLQEMEESVLQKHTPHPRTKMKIMFHWNFNRDPCIRDSPFPDQQECILASEILKTQ